MSLTVEHIYVLYIYTHEFLISWDVWKKKSQQSEPEEDSRMLLYVTIDLQKTKTIAKAHEEYPKKFKNNISPMKT